LRARWLARAARLLFVARPMPALREPRGVAGAAGKRLPVAVTS